eukprot:2957989-Rhodomonas_salina.2
MSDTEPRDLYGTSLRDVSVLRYAMPGTERGYAATREAAHVHGKGLRIQVRVRIASRVHSVTVKPGNTSAKQSNSGIDARRAWSHSMPALSAYVGAFGGRVAMCSTDVLYGDRMSGKKEQRAYEKDQTRRHLNAAYQIVTENVRTPAPYPRHPAYAHPPRSPVVRTPNRAHAHTMPATPSASC